MVAESAGDGPRSLVSAWPKHALRTSVPAYAGPSGAEWHFRIWRGL